MPVTTEIIKTEQLSDGAIGITVRANDDPKTDAVLTIYNIALMTADAIQGVIDNHHKLVAARALAMSQARAQLTGLKKISVSHDDADLQTLLTSQQPTRTDVVPAKEFEVSAVAPVKAVPNTNPNLPEGITVAPTQPAPQAGDPKAAPSRRGK